MPAKKSKRVTFVFGDSYSAVYDADGDAMIIDEHDVVGMPAAYRAMGYEVIEKEADFAWLDSVDGFPEQLKDVKFND